MLRLILGRAGAGKTAYLHNLLGDYANAGREGLILLVPEQDSFAHERDILRLLGEQAAQRVEVLSFSRLANAVFRQFGGQGREANEAAQALCMSLALEAMREKLRLFVRADERMVPALLRLRRELCAAGERPAELHNAALRLHQAKLVELALILQAFDAILAERFGGAIDPMQSLAETLATPDGRAFFAGKTIALDAFQGFTCAEIKLIKILLECAEDVFVTLCLDQLQSEDDSVFEHTRRTAATLIDMARQAAVPVAAPVCLPEYGEIPRYQSPALAHLEAAFLQEQQHWVYEHATDDITLCVCEDVEAECAWAARNIARLLRENPGMRCREFAILARDATTYERTLCAALRRVGLPMFEDARQPVAAQPLMRLVSAALEIAAEGFRCEAVMKYLKTGLTGMNEEDIAALENYALLWRVEGAAWLRPWAAHPQGLHQQENESSAAIAEVQLAVLNQLRLRAVAPLEKFREAMRDCTGISGAAALDELLQSVHVPAALKKLRAELTENGQPVEALELARVWDLCMGLLDQIAQALEEQYTGARRFAALFALLLSVQTLGELPQSLDAVTFGAAERVRPQNPNIVFVLGLNDGVFPRPPTNDGLITDRDRAALLELGFAMQDLAPRQLAMERLMVYRTLCAPRQKLFCSWALRSAAGDELRPSPMVHWLTERFPQAKLQDNQRTPPLEMLEGEHAGFALLCKELHTQNELTAALLHYFQSKPAYAPKIAALMRMAAERPESLRLQNSNENPQASAYFTPSQAEVYAQCPFQYFCKYNLKLQPRKTADFDPLLRGNILHMFLETLFRAHGTEALLAMNAECRNQAIDEVLDDYAKKHLAVEGLPARVTYLFRRLRDICAQVLERLLREFNVSAFRPVAFELSISRDQAVQPREIALPGGGALSLGGKADRVDCAEVNGRTYFRVVDYKSGGKSFELGHIFDGLNLQMLVYLFALWDTTAQPFAGALPAGVLYTQANDKILTVQDRRASEDEIAREKQSAARAAGFVLEDDSVLCAMEEGGLGVFLPAKLGKSKHMLSLERLGKLQRAVDDILVQEIVSLQSGEIPALPLQQPKTGQTPCAYCAYQAVCGREPGHAAKPAQGLSFEDAVAMLDGV